MLRLLNEAVACLREQVTLDEDLLDAGVIFGTGFAPFRGGPLRYNRQEGISRQEQQLKSLEERSTAPGSPPIRAGPRSSLTVARGRPAYEDGVTLISCPAGTPDPPRSRGEEEHSLLVVRLPGGRGEQLAQDGQAGQERQPGSCCRGTPA